MISILRYLTDMAFETHAQTSTVSLNIRHNILQPFKCVFHIESDPSIANIYET